jgi:hypothetical protein
MREAGGIQVGMDTLKMGGVSNEGSEESEKRVSDLCKHGIFSW